MTALAFAEYALSSRRSVQTVSVAENSSIASIADSSVVCGTAGGSALRQETGIPIFAGSDAQPDSAAHRIR